MFTVTHPFHPLYGQQFEILSYRCCWGDYRVTFYETPDRVRILPAAWTSLAPPDPSVILAAGGVLPLTTVDNSDVAPTRLTHELRNEVVKGSGRAKK